MASARSLSSRPPAGRIAFTEQAATNDHYSKSGLERVIVHVPTGNEHTLALTNIKRPDIDASAPAVLMLHGAISNGKVFYSDKAHGLGPFLAKSGMNVFIGDLRGRGLSQPSLEDEAKQLGM